MSQPVLDVGHVPTSIHEVDGDRVPKNVRMPPIDRQLRRFSVSLEKLVDRGGGESSRTTLPRDEEKGPAILATLGEVRPEQSASPGMNGVFA